MRSAAGYSSSTTGCVADQAAYTALGVLERLIRSGDTTRSAALDVLTADALITYGCEAACDEPASLAAFCDAAFRAALRTAGPAFEHGSETSR